MPNLYPFNDMTPSIGKDVFIAPDAAVIGNAEIGDYSSIWFGAVVRSDIQKITIGKNTNVQDNVTIHTMYEEPTNIGDNVTIGHNAVIHCRSIGNNCLIGMGSVIMGFSEIGECCIIGANSFIPQNKKIPPYSMVYGNPAKIIRSLREDEIEALQASADGYKELASHYLNDTKLD